ncbi:MAG: hypothetical protein JNK60_10180, partial [Acidobacteria bacterium]|nr:hypothetical protein [Acidobacteriota bacterium]
MKSTSRRPRLRALALGLGLTALLSSGPLQAAVCTSAGTGNWSAIAWSCVPVAPAPVGGDDIIIAGAVTFDLPSFSANTLTVNVAASLTINAGTQLDVTAPGAASITVVSGGLLTVNGTLGPAGAPTAGMNVQAGGAVGTARVNGTLWVASVDLQSGTSGALLDVPPGGTANVTGALTSVGNGYFTVGTAIGLAANLNAGSVSLGFGSASTVGRLSTLDVAGNFALASSADLQLTTSTSRVFIGGSASGTGTFGCASGSTVTYDGGLAGQAVYPTSYGNLVINKSGGTQAFVNGAVVAFNNSLNIQAGSLWDNGAQIAGAFPATIVMGPNTLLTLGSGGVATLFPTSVPAGNITFDPTSTVEYSSGAGIQQISAVPTYANLNVTTRGSGATTKNLPGAQVLNINGNLDISNASGTTTFGMGQDTVHVGLNVTGNGGIGFETTTGALNIGGSFLNTGSFVRDLSTVTYFGQGGPFTVRGGIIYHNLVLQPGAPVLTTFQPGGGNLSVFNSFTLANGVSTVLDLGASSLSVAASALLNGLITGTAGVSNVNLSGSLAGVGGISGSALNFGTTAIAAGSDITAGGPVTLPASTVTNSGTFRSTNNAGIDGMSGFWIQGPNALLDVNGPLMPTGSLNASAAGNTVRFLGTAIGQTLPATNYFHIEIAKGLQTAGLGGGISVAGNLVVTSGILNTGQFQIGGNATGILTLAGGAEMVIGNPSVALGPTFPTNYTGANITLAPTSIVKYIANAAQFINIDVGAGGYGFLQTGTGNTNSLKTAAGAGFLLVQNTLTIGNVVPFTGNPTLSMGGINLTAQDVSGSGDLTFTTGNLTINRDFNNTGLYAAGTGTTTYATGTAGQVRGTTYNNLQISGPNKTAAGGFTVNGNLTIGALGGLAAGAFNHFVSGNYTLTGGGTFLPQTSSMFFQGSSPQNVTASPFHHVAFLNTAGTTLTGGIAVGGNVLINATAVVNAGAFNHLVSGNWTNAGTFNPGTSTVTFDGTASRNIGNGPFYNVTFQNAGPFNLTTVTSFLNNVVISATGPATLATGNGFDIGGNWQNDGVFAASDGVANFNGAAPQTIGGTQNTTFSSLQIANPTGVTLNRDVDVQVGLSLFSGILATGPNKVNVPAAATLSRTSGWVFGALSRGFAGPGTDTFWVGTASTLGEVGVTVNAGAGFFTVRSVSGLHPNRTGPNVLSRYWTLTPGGITSANLVFYYQDTDVTGSELAYVLGRYAPPWTYPPATVDSMFNTATANAVTAFGDFTLGEPASIAGVATQLVLTRAGAGNFTAGTADNLTLTALDASGGVSLSYTGLHNITFAGANPSPNPATPPSVSSSTGTQIAFGTAVPLNFVAGVATVSGANNGVLRLYRTEAVAITATDGTIATAAPLAFNVVHGPLGKFTFALATPQQNGVNFTGPSTLRAEDAFGNTATSFNASVQPVTVTANAPLSGAVSFAGHGANVLNLAGDFAAGIANLQTLQMRYTGLSGTGTFTATQGAVNSASNPVVVNAGVPDHFTVVAAASSQTAGSINLLTITAVDANGNVATSYTGNHNLTFAGANPAPNAGTAPTVNDVFGSPVPFGTATILSFTNGVAQATGFTNGAMTLYRAETAAITATDGSLVTPVPFTVVVNTRPAIRFRFQLTSPQVNGVAFTGVNTLTAEDIYGNTVTTFSAAVDNVTIEPVAPLAGTVSGLGSAGNNVLDQASSFVLGVANLTGAMRFAGSGSGEFSATSLGFASGTSNTISITNGPPTQLAITSVNGGVSPTAGLPFGIVVEAQTAGGLPSNVSASTNVSISLLSGTGTLAGTLTGTILAGTSSVAIGGLTYTKAETGVVLQAARTSGDVLASGPSAPFTVVSGALDHFLVEAAGGGNIAPQTAGAPFALRITAFDAYGNVVTAYGGTVLLTSHAALTGAPVSSGAFTNGVLASQNVTITSAQVATTVTATDGAFSGTSNAFVVNPAGVVSFLVEAGSGGSIAPQTAGVAFPIRITARDAFGNTATSFTGTPDLTITAGGLTPPTVVFGAADNGVRTLNVTAATAGSMQSITVSDVPTAGTGTSNPFTVNPAAGGGATNFLVEAGAGGAIAPQRTGVPFAIRITAKTAGGAVDTAFTGVATLTTTAGLVSPSNVTFGAGDNGVKTVNVTVSTAGITQTISATSGAVTGTSNPFTVDPSSWSISVTGLDGGSIGTQVNGVPFDIEIALSDSGAIRRRLLAGGTFEGNLHLSTNQGSVSPSVIPFVAADNNLKLVSVTVTGGGPLQTITATEPLTGSAGTSATFTVTGGGGGGTAPDLSLTKSHAGTFFVGSPGAYTLTVFNGGNAPTTGPITITDILPAGLSFVS